MTDMQLHQTYPSVLRSCSNRLAVATKFSARVRLASLLCGAMLLLSLSACVTVQEQDGHSAAQSVAPTAVVPAHDLALTAVEMANSMVILRSDQLALMAVVENQGTEPARDIPVRVLVSDGADEVLLESTQYIDELPAGDTTIVRFEQRTSIPTRSSYELLVEVVPVDEESITSNNVRAYNVSVELR